MASFSLPPISDNPEGGWGPSPANFPAQFRFKDIPYAPYSKSDKLGRFADWNDIAGDNRQGAGASSGQTGPRTGGRNARNAPQAFGSGAANAFAYFHVEDESSFSVVANTATQRRGGPLSRGRGGARGNYNRTAQRGGRGGFNINRGGGGQRGGRRGWRDWDKVHLLRSAMLGDTSQYQLRTIALERDRLRSRQNGECWRKLSLFDLRSFAWRSTHQKICTYS